MRTKIAEAYKSARKHLGLTQRQAGSAVGISNPAIVKLEKGKTDNPNWEYTKFLVEQGINYFYLIGLSDEIEGQLIETVSKSEHETLKSNYEDLKEEKEILEKQVSEMIPRSEWEKLKDKIKNYESIFKMLKVEKG